MTKPATEGDPLFFDAIQGLLHGDFSRLEPLFNDRLDAADRRPKIIVWFDAGLFREQQQALAEALSCACFLGRTTVAEYLMTHGVDPSAGTGTGTGMNAFHWSANRGQLETVRLLIQRGAPLETRNMYGGTVLGLAVWSAIHEPRAAHPQIIEELLRAGALLENAEYPTGNQQVDAILCRHGAA
jgi:Ankyrin repeats (3 copies)